MSRLRLVFWVVPVILAGGCGGGSQAGKCAVGLVVECPCSSGLQGFQKCTSAGTFAPCQCSSLGAADAAPDVPVAMAETGSGGMSTGGYGGTTSAGGVVSSGGTTSAGGVVGVGGTTSAGGVAGVTTSTGGVLSSGGMTSAGGVLSSGGMTSTGAVLSSGGMTSTGGVLSPGGTTSAGGVVGAGGTTSTGGVLSSGGTTSAAGAVGTGGITVDGGAVSSGGWSGTLTTLVSPFRGTPVAIAADATSVYWVNEGTEANSFKDGTVMKVATSGATAAATGVYLALRKRCTNPTWRRRAGIGSLRVCADDTRVSSGAN